jgi:hypothetical protein
MFETTIIAEKGDSVGSIIAQAIADNPATAGKMGLKAFEKVLRRAAGKTGSMLFKKVRGAFTAVNPYSLAPLQIHPSGVRIAPKITSYFAKKRGKGGKNYTAPGVGFRSLMQYRMTPDVPKGAPAPAGPPNVEVGLIPERRGGKEWAEKFKSWQEGGTITYPGRERAMYAMLAYLGIPDNKATPLTAPKREVIEKIEQREDPLAMFRKNLYERLK